MTDDLVSSHILIHKFNTTSTKIYNLTNGYLITTLPYSINRILITRYCKSLIMDNKILINF